MSEKDKAEAYNMADHLYREKKLYEENKQLRAELEAKEREIEANKRDFASYRNEITRLDAKLAAQQKVIEAVTDIVSDFGCEWAGECRHEPINNRCIACQLLATLDKGAATEKEG